MTQQKQMDNFLADSDKLRKKMLIDNECATLFRKVQEYLPNSERRNALGDEVISQALYRAYTELREYTL